MNSESSNNYGALIAGCLKRDPKSQRDLYNLFAPTMLGVCRRYAPDLETARDILQEGFVTVFEKIGTYKGAGSFEGWMRKIFANTALMQLRHSDVLRQSDELTAAEYRTPAAGGPLEQIQANELMRLINSMPVGFKTVFNLYVLEDFSHQEIAKMLGISEGTSRSQLNRARLWLQERITEERKRIK